MAKRVSKKERIFNLESYVELLVERIERLERDNQKHSESISNIVVDVRNLEVKLDRNECSIQEIGECLNQAADTVKNHKNHIEALEEKINEILTTAKDANTKNAIVNYLISTDFKGSVRHKRLVSRLKREVKEALKANSFEELKREILNGDRSLDDLIDYKHILMKHEDDQKVVDYCNKEEE